MNEPPNTVLLIHGQWVTPRSWSNFRSYYEARGYRVLTPAWPGMEGEVEAMRRDPSVLAGLGIREIAKHYERIIRSLDDPPILMGHSAGGLVTQILLDRGVGAAGVAIDSVPPKGIYRLPFSAIQAAKPVLSNPLNYWRTVAFTFEQFRYAFANTLSDFEAQTAFEKFAIAGPGRPTFQIASANLNPWAPTKVNFRNSARAPLLLIAGTEDHFAPAIINSINYRKYKHSGAITAFKEFPRRCHFIIGQEGWQEVAAYALDWAEANTGCDCRQSA